MLNWTAESRLRLLGLEGVVEEFDTWTALAVRCRVTGRTLARLNNWAGVDEDYDRLHVWLDGFAAARDFFRVT